MEINKEKVLGIIEEFKKEAWDDYCSTGILTHWIMVAIETLVDYYKRR